MGLNRISWGDIAEWRRVTGNVPFTWELIAIQTMDTYRIDPDYDPKPIVKKKSLVEAFSELKRQHEAENSKAKK